MSANHSGRRRGSVSPTAALRRALSRADADRFAQRLVSAAKGGDLSAYKIIFDRVDHPLSGPMAIALAQTNAQAVNDISPHGAPAQIIIMDNGRDKMPFDADGYKHDMRKLMGMPNTATDSLPPSPPPTEPELNGEEAEQSPAGVISGSDFLKAG